MYKNYEIFESEMEEMLSSNTKYKNTTKYKSEIKLFMQYLEAFNLKSKILVLNKNDIDSYFIYCMEANKIGAKNTLNTQISALKSIFEYLIENNYKFEDILGYINTKEFRNNISDKLKGVKNKSLIPMNSLNDMVYSLDNYLVKHASYSELKSEKQKQLVKVYFVRLYIKLNLLIPIKPSEMLDLEFNMFSNNYRLITYNGFDIHVPNSLRADILNTISFIESTFESNFSDEGKIFQYIGSNISNGSLGNNDASLWFGTVFKILGLDEYSKSRSFPIEKIKKSVIWNMLNDGVNILILSEFTGLGIETLISDGIFSYDKKIASREINSKLSMFEYYSFL